MLVIIPVPCHSGLVSAVLIGGRGRVMEFSRSK